MANCQAEKVCWRETLPMASVGARRDETRELHVDGYLQYVYGAEVHGHQILE
jgi:hypothetical protein